MTTRIVNQVIRYRRPFSFNHVEQNIFGDEMASSEPLFDENPNLLNGIQIRAFGWFAPVCTGTLCC